MSEELSVEERAAQLGHIPREQWQGDPDAYVDAEEFLRRADNIMPILKANNRSLSEKLSKAQAETVALKSTVDELKRTMKDFQSFQLESLQTALTQQRERLLAERKAARDEGDDNLVDDLNDRLAEVKVKEKEVQKSLDAAPEPTTPQPVPEHPEFASWRAENPWYGKDEERTELAEVYARQLIQTGKHEGKTGRAFFDLVKSKVFKALPEESPTPTKVGGTRASGGASPSSGKTGYESLPPEAKAQCDADAKRFVGENKVFKDEAAWRKHFAAQYKLATGG